MKLKQWIASTTALALVFTLATFSAPQKAQALTTEVTIELVTEGSSGTGGNGMSFSPTLSNDGTTIVFHSEANDLVSGTTTPGYSIFAYDAISGETTYVSAGSSPLGDNNHPSVSADGNLVVISSYNAFLVPGITTGSSFNIFLYDLAAATVTLVTPGATGTGGDDSSFSQSISADGSKIAFASRATDLIDGITTTGTNVFLYDVASATTTLVTPGLSGTGSDSVSAQCQISADGNRIVFISSAGDLIDGMSTYGYDNVYLYDVPSATTSIISAGASGVGANNICGAPVISADGTKIVFESWATDLVSGMTTTGPHNIFLYDTVSATTTLITAGSSGTGSDGVSRGPSISADGAKIAFHSLSSDLVDGMPATERQNIFLYDVASATTTLITTGPLGTGGNDASLFPSISADGTRIAFYSSATDLIEGTTTDNLNNIYLYTFTTYALVTFDADNGDAVATAKTVLGTMVREPAEPVYAGHTFEGWFTSGDTLWVFGDPVTDDMVLTARWSVAPETPVEPEVPLEPEVPIEPDTRIEPDIPQTGDLVPLVPIALIALAGFALSTVSINRRRRHDRA